MRKILKWTLIGIGVLFALGVFASLVSPDVRDGIDNGIQAGIATPTPSPTPTATPTPSPTPSPAPTPTSTPVPTPDPEAGRDAFWALFDATLDTSLVYDPDICSLYALAPDLAVETFVDGVEEGFAEGSDETVAEMFNEWWDPAEGGQHVREQLNEVCT